MRTQVMRTQDNMRTMTQMWRMNAHTLELYRGNQWLTYYGMPPTCLPDRPILPILDRDGDRDGDPVSPPSSPREPGEDEDEDEDVDEEWVWHYHDIIYTFERDRWEKMNKPVRPRKIKQKNKGKEMRRNGRLKQPGGASCNQRR
jgi:hypothetical protein